MRQRAPLPPALAVKPFTVGRALEMDVTPSRLRGDDLATPFRGVRLPSTDQVTIAMLCRALQTKLPDYAWFCGVTAAELTRMPLPPKIAGSRTLHVAVPVGRRTLVGRGIAGHTFTDSRWRRVADLRVSSPVRTWLECAPVLGVYDLVAAADYLIHWRSPIATIEELGKAVASGAGVRGIRKLRRAVELVHPRAESPQESILRAMLSEQGLVFDVNVPIRTSGGADYRADLVLQGTKVIVEYYGDHHRDPQAFRRDLTRVRLLESDGWRVVVVSIDDLADPRDLALRIRRLAGW